MLTNVQRWVVFCLFCLAVVACIILEFMQGYSTIKNGFNLKSAVLAVLLGGVVYGCGRLFVRLIERTFLAKGITADRLNQIASARCEIVAQAQRSRQEEYLIRQKLVENTLKFSEAWLKGWAKGSHFEFCVFVDLDMPLLFAYFDSKRDTTSASMAKREANPRFYVEQHYEVTKLLQKPTSKPLIIGDTADGKTGYFFESPGQREQIRSTILLCPSVSVACALVVTSDRKNAFPKSDQALVDFISSIAELALYDVVQDDFIKRIRGLRSNLFVALAT